MKAITLIATLLALLLANFNYAQSTKDSTVKKPMVIDGKKMRITIDTKDKSEETDTRKIIIDGDTTIIEEHKEITKDSEKGGVKKTKKKTYTRKIDDDEDEKRNPKEWFNMDLGFNFLTNNGTLDMPENYKDLELENGKGCNFNLKIYEQSISIVPQHLYLVYGVGLDWNNYRFKNNVDLMKDSIPLAYSISSIDYKKNKLVSTYLTAPLLIKVKFRENEKGDAFKIAVGPQFGYLINSHTKQKWDQGGDHKQKLNGDFNLTEFRVGYSLYLGYDDINFYARYFPNSAFKENRGPDVNTVCVGLAIGGF